MSAATATPAKEMAGELEPAAAPPEPERLVSDPDTLRAIADPLRLRILETMVTRALEPWSVKELAAALGVPQTRLYHHIDLLLERDLIRAASRRLVSGIVETRYQVAALSLRLDPHLFSGEDEGATATALMTNVLDAARGDIIAAVQAAAANPDDQAPDRPVVSRGLARLTPERAAELRARLVALIDEFDDGERADARPYGFFVAFYPAPQRGGDASR